MAPRAHFFGHFLRRVIPHPEDGGDDRGDDDVIGTARTYCVSIPAACVFV